MVSIALCTYNGARYIREQLDSILNQTLLPDEIIICDDCSSDSTVSILKEYQTRYAGLPICLYENERNLGFRKNFRKAIDLCCGDLIFLSDQDDIWLPDKIETIFNWFRKHQDKNVVFSNGLFVDENSKPAYENFSLFKCVGMTRTARFWLQCGYGMELFLKNNRATGATIAFRSVFKERLEIVDEGPLHDELICLKAINEDCLGLIAKPLILYRIHSSQACGLSACLISPQHTDNIISPLNDHITNGELFSDRKLVYRYKLLRDRLVWVRSSNGLHKVVRSVSRYIHAYPYLFIICMTYDILLYFKYGREGNSTC